jgi:hypothetical protein
MKLKYCLVFLIMLLLINPIFSLDLGDIIENIEDRASDYDSQKTNLCEFLVYTKYEVASLYDYKENNKGNQEITKQEINSVFENNELRIPTKDFDLRIESFKNKKEDSYSLLFSLEPTKKQIENAFQKAEDDFITDYLNKNPDANIYEKPIDIKIDHEILDSEIKLNSAIEIRKQFQNCMPSFADWYFDLLSKDLEYYFLAGSGYEFVIEQINEVSRSVYYSMDVLDIDTWPKEFSKIDIDYKDGKKILKVWEEKNVDNSLGSKGIWTTYYSYLNFPTKSEMRKIISTKLSDSLTKGADREITESKANDHKNRLKNIEKVSNKYGGSLDFILSIEDTKEPIFKKFIIINPKDILKTEDVSIQSENNLDKDFSIIIDFDQMYDFMEVISVDVGQINKVAPRWVEKIENKSNAQHVLKVLVKTFTSWNKILKIEPVTEIPKLIFNLTTIIDALGD